MNRKIPSFGKDAEQETEAEDRDVTRQIKAREKCIDGIRKYNAYHKMRDKQEKVTQALYQGGAVGHLAGISKPDLLGTQRVGS